MSDNISQLHPQKHPGLGKRIAVFAVLLVFVTGGVAAYVFRDRLNLDALQRYVRYLNVSEDSKTGRFVYDESNSNRYAGLSGGLSVASFSGTSPRSIQAWQTRHAAVFGSSSAVPSAPLNCAKSCNARARADNCVYCLICGSFHCARSCSHARSR